MKRIGTTNQGNVLLECSQREASMLSALEMLMSGGTLPVWGVSPEYGHVDSDMTDVFNAITEWIQIKDRANLIRHCANELDAALGTPKSNG